MVFLNAAPQGGGMTSTIVMFVLIIAIMYFMMIRPQRKQQKKIENFRRGLQVGQEVVTSGGIYGKIKEIKDGIVSLEIAHNVVVKVDISVVYPDPSAAQEQGR
ncbi:MAG: preprotein translocase subunit YajC [Bacteroidaceae bacterium]|nr:preprotein translocase subunit YajC [Bacteroidaceae bacterium]